MGWYHDEPVLIIRASNSYRSLGWDLLPPGSQRFDWPHNGSTYPGYGESPESWVTGTGPSPFPWYAGKEFADYFLDESDMGPAFGWEGGVTYPINAQIRYNGVVYKCSADHTSTSASEPGVGADWETRPFPKPSGVALPTGQAVWPPTVPTTSPHSAVPSTMATPEPSAPHI